MKRIGEQRLVKALIEGYSSMRFNMKFVFLSLAFGLGVVAVMNPRQPGSSEKVSAKGIDVMIALDVSKSMLATDVQPSRLQKAKELINELMDKLPDDQFGLVLFAGKAYLQMPQTIDHDAIKTFVSTAGPGTVPVQGTVISEALNMSARAFVNEDKSYKAVVLISDGEDHDENAINTASELAQQGIMINCIGIGSPEGATIKDTLTGGDMKDETGNTVVSKLNETELKQIAEKTNGVYTRLQEVNDATAVLMKQLSQIDKKALTDTVNLDYKSFYCWAAVAMFLFLLIENFIPEKKKTA